MRLALREVRELRRSDVDLTRGVVKVERGVVRAGTTIHIAEPKTDAARRTVHIPASLLDDVRAHLREHTQLGPKGLLFWGQDGTNVDDRLWRKVWLRACRDAGAEGVQFHDLRHVDLTYTAVAGATLRELQSIAGDTTPAMAMRYQEIAADHLQEVIKGLDAIISGSSGKPNPVSSS